MKEVLNAPCDDLESVLRDIIEKTVLLYGNLPSVFPEPSICFVNDICKAIEDDDRQFIDDTCLKKESWIGGLLYINKDNMPIIYVKKGDETDIGIANLIISLVHEITHFFDYMHFAQFMKSDDLRELQKDRPFLFWTEFHATYISVLYAISYGILHIEPDKILIGLKEEMNLYCDKNELLQLEPTVNFFSRLFGKYWAWKHVYKELPIYPLEIIIDVKMGRLCKFFYNHSSFDELKDDIDKLDAVVYAFETKHKRERS